jgi:hypothetical protein
MGEAALPLAPLVLCQKLCELRVSPRGDSAAMLITALSVQCSGYGISRTFAGDEL